VSLAADVRVGVDEVRLREYRRGDLDAIFALDVVCFEPPFRFTREAMRRFAEAKSALTVIAESGEEIAGFSIAQVERVGGARAAYVVTLDVAPEWRRRGLAQRMMRQIEEQARAAQCVEMALHVSVENESAVRFYERAGYERTQVVRDFYGRGRDALVYFKMLVQSSVAPAAE
jgi:ribosomal-protein-alanine N-acetyltransferase